MNTDKAAYFLSIVKEGSFSAAAAKHYISQTAISMQMASLEQELGTVLFLRTSRGAVLTKAGKKLLPLAAAFMEAYQQMLDGMKEAESRHKHITVAYTGPIEKALLEDAFIRLYREHPEIELTPLQFPMSMLTEKLMEGVCDVVLSIPSEIQTQGFLSEVISEYETKAAVSVVSELAGRETVTLKELSRYPMITLQAEASHVAAEEVRHWCRWNGFSKSRNLMADSIENQLFMVALNQGVSFIPDSLAIAEPGVKLIPVEDYRHIHQTVTVYRKQTPEIMALVAALKSSGKADGHKKNLELTHDK